MPETWKFNVFFSNLFRSQRYKRQRFEYSIVYIHFMRRMKINDVVNSSEFSAAQLV